MGGVYTLSVTNQLTHLVTNNVRTEKYAVTIFLLKRINKFVLNMIRFLGCPIVEQTRDVRLMDRRCVETKLCPKC